MSIMEELSQSIIDGKADEIKELVQKALNGGLPQTISWIMG